MSYLYSKLPETGVPPHIGTGGIEPITSSSCVEYRSLRSEKITVTKITRT
jgi:hypothetical protein